MPHPGVYGIPSQNTFGLPVDRSPLRAYMRQTVQDSASSQSDSSIAATLAQTPLPGSIILAAFGAESPGPGVNDPDLYSVSQTGYWWGSLGNHGSLDGGNWPYSELWMGIPKPGIVGGTVVTCSGNRGGGWMSWSVAEVPNIQGRYLGCFTYNWANTTAFTTTMGTGINADTAGPPVAPVDCLAVAFGCIDSGGAANPPTVAVNPGWSISGAGANAWLAIRPLPKGQKAAITTGTARSDFQVVAIALMV